MVSTFRLDEPSIITKYMRQGTVALSLERLQYGHFGYNSYIVQDFIDDYQVMQEDMYSQYTVASSGKSWPILPQLDDLILQLTEHGFQKHWENQVISLMKIFVTLLIIFIFYCSLLLSC